MEQFNRFLLFSRDEFSHTAPNYMVPMCLSQVTVTTSTSRFCEGLWPLPYDHAVPCSGERGHSSGDTESRLQITSAYIPKSGCSMVSGY